MGGSTDNTTAQTMLGQIYSTGIPGVQQNINQAITYLTKASDKGNTQAKRILANIYLSDQYAVKNTTKAISLLESAAENNDVQAQATLGKIYLQGNIVPYDDQRAKKLLLSSAYNGNVKAQSFLALMYYQQNMITKEFSKAISFAQLAAEQNDSDALLLLGVIYYFESDNSPETRAKGMKYLIRATEQNNKLAIDMVNSLKKFNTMLQNPIALLQ